MSRRRLRLVCSSDEEDEELPPPEQQQQEEDDIEDDDIIDDIDTDFQTVTLNSSNPTPNTNSSTTNRNNTRMPEEPIPFEISDDDENVIIESNSMNNSNYGNTNGNNHSHFGVSDSSVNGVLEMLGLRLKKEWLDSCLSGLQASMQGFQGMDDSAKAKLCFRQFLLSDMNYCGAGVLPPNVHALHLVDLKGPFVLQVDEVVNISCPLRGRYQNAASGIKRCLKLSMTDGVQRIFGMEYRPIKALEALSPAGMKIALCNVNIRHGLLLLVPEVLEVLGGSVEELDAARHRLIAEINKPPRGKRNRTGIVPPLATRATLAAWPQDNVAVPENVDRNTSANTAPLQANPQGTALAAPINDGNRQTFTVPVGNNTPFVSRQNEHVGFPSDIVRSASTPIQAAGRGTTFGSFSNDRHRPDVAVPVSRNNGETFVFSAKKTQESAGQGSSGTSFGNSSSDRPRQDFAAASMSRNSTEFFVFSAQRPQESVSTPHNYMEVTTPVRATGCNTSPVISANYVPVEDVTVPSGRDSTEPKLSFTVDMDVEEISMGDWSEHAFLFSRDKETPFTYLASLSAKLAAIEDQGSIIRGKIKCFVTAVKGFQFKQRATYELRVYVDDGSLICEISIDHKVVQNLIGYSPEEVTNALTSSDSDRLNNMKNTLKQFQIFLINFEGTMLVEMNNTSPVPIATEMNQGCSESDALLLLKRLKSYTSVQAQKHSRSNPINLSQ